MAPAPKLLEKFCSPTLHCSDSFVEIRHNHVWFVDNTHMLAWLNSNTFPSHAIFRRPPRFGKSFWLHLLNVYYDIACPENVFRYCFGNLKVGPQIPQRRHMIFQIDFSTAKVGPYNNLLIKNVVMNAIQVFARRYRHILDWSIPELPAKGVIHLLFNMFFRAKSCGYTIMMLIDEIDFGTSWAITSHLQTGSASDRIAATIFSLAKNQLITGVLVRGIAVGISTSHVTDDLCLSVWQDLTHYPKSHEMFGIRDTSMKTIIY